MHKVDVAVAIKHEYKTTAGINCRRATSLPFLPKFYQRTDTIDTVTHRRPISAQSLIQKEVRATSSISEPPSICYFILSYSRLHRKLAGYVWSFWMMEFFKGFYNMHASLLLLFLFNALTIGDGSRPVVVSASSEAVVSRGSAELRGDDGRSALAEVRLSISHTLSLQPTSRLPSLGHYGRFVAHQTNGRARSLLQRRNLVSPCCPREGRLVGFRNPIRC